VKKLLADYQKPPIDPAIEDALNDYVARKKAASPDAFV
jgi:trimethylamine--corrinoid protein Co-methyltransferase